MDQNNTTVGARHQVPQCLQQTAEAQYFQLLLRPAAAAADRGNLVLQHLWITEELVDEPAHPAAAVLIPVTVLIVVSATMVAAELMVKDIQVGRALDLM
jgi:hypothetical protein